MNREQMVERVVTVMLSEYIEEDLTPRAWDYMLAEKVLDAILPQITTVEELEALPVGTKLLASNGAVFEFWEATHGVHAGWRTYRFTGNRAEYSSELVAERYGPFAVVWRP